MGGYSTTPEQRADARRLWEAGWDGERIGRYVGVTGQQVRNWARDLGWDEGQTPGGACKRCDGANLGCGRCKPCGLTGA
jgi:uncharacterized protein YjcR